MNYIPNLSRVTPAQFSVAQIEQGRPQGGSIDDLVGAGPELPILILGIGMLAIFAQVIRK